MNNDENPDGEMIDLSVHKSLGGLSVSRKFSCKAISAFIAYHATLDAPLSTEARGDVLNYSIDFKALVAGKSVQIRFGERERVLDYLKMWFRVVCNDDFHDIESEKNIGIIQAFVARPGHHEKFVSVFRDQPLHTGRPKSSRPRVFTSTKTSVSLSRQTMSISPPVRPRKLRKRIL